MSLSTSSIQPTQPGYPVDEIKDGSWNDNFSEQFLSLTDLIFRIKIPAHKALTKDQFQYQTTEIVSYTAHYLSTNKLKYTEKTSIAKELIDVVDLGDGSVPSFELSLRNVKKKLATNIDWFVKEFSQWTAKTPSEEAERIKGFCVKYKNDVEATPAVTILQNKLIQKVRQSFSVIKNTNQFETDQTLKEFFEREDSRDLGKSIGSVMFKEEAGTYNHYLNNTAFYSDQTSGLELIAKQINDLCEKPLETLQYIPEWHPGVIVAYISDHSPLLRVAPTSYGRILTINTQDKLVCLRDSKGNPKEIPFKDIQ